MPAQFHLDFSAAAYVPARFISRLNVQASCSAPGVEHLSDKAEPGFFYWDTR